MTYLDRLSREITLGFLIKLEIVFLMKNTSFIFSSLGLNFGLKY
jgi:hypothetical protein